MAKYRRRRFRRRSSRWSPNIVKIANTNVATPGEFLNYEELAVNPVQQLNSGISQRFTAKNVECSFTIEALRNVVTYLEALSVYIMYVPQGYQVTSTLYVDHPEWIMAYKYLGTPFNDPDGTTTVGQQFQPIKVRTRLSRKLDTGDRIILYVQGSNQHTENVNYNIYGLVRWWSKAN